MSRNSLLETGAKSEVSFFAQIKNPKLKTGLESKVREAKVINKSNEDKQAFGLLVAK